MKSLLHKLARVILFAVYNILYSKIKITQINRMFMSINFHQITAICLTEHCFYNIILTYTEGYFYGSRWKSIKRNIFRTG